MPLLLNKANQFQSSTAFTTPDGNENRAAFAARNKSRLENESFISGALMTPPAVLISMMDTFAETFGIVEDDEVEDYLKRNMPAFGKFFEDNREAIGFAGDIAGLFIPAGLATKAVRSTSAFGKLATKTFGPGVTKFLSTGKSNQRIFEEVVERGKVLANKRGIDVVADLEFRALRRKAIGRSVADVAIESVAADLAIAGTMRSSDFLFPDEMSLVDNLVFFGAANAVVSGAAYAGARYVLRTQMNKFVGPLAAKAQNPGGIPLSTAQGKVDARGPQITVHGATLQEVLEENRAALAIGDQELAQNTKAETESIKLQISKILQKAFQDDPMAGVTSSTKLKGSADEGSPEISTLLNFLAEQPGGLEGLRALERFSPESGRMFEANMKSLFATSKVKIKVLKEDIAILERRLDKQKVPNAKLVAKHEAKQDELIGLERQFEDNLSTSGVIVEIDGLVTTPGKRGEIFQDGERLIAKMADNVNEVANEATGFRAIVNPDGTFRFKKRGVKNEVFTDPFDLFGGVFPQQFQNTAKSIGKLNLVERTAIADAMQSALERRVPRTAKEFELPVGAHHTQIDFVLDILGREGDEALKKISSFDSLNPSDLEYRSLAQKFEELQRFKLDEIQRFKTDPKFQKAVLDGTDRLASNHDLARMFNLPGDDHPLMKWMLGGMDNNQVLPLKSLAKDLNEVKAALVNMVETNGTKAAQIPVDPSLKFRGNMLALDRRKKPVLTIQRSIDPGIDVVSRDQMLQSTAAVRMEIQEALRTSDTVIAKQVMAEIDARPVQVKSFLDGMTRLFAGNDANGKFLSMIFSQAFRNRGLPGFKAIDELVAVIQKASDQVIDRLLVGPKKSFSKILEAQNKGSLVSFFTARTALGAGWDVKGQLEKLPASGAEGEVFGVVLKNTERNQTIWKNTFDEAMPEGKVFLPVTGGSTPVAVTALARETLEGFDFLGQTLLKEINAVRKAKGFPEVAAKELHLPPKDMSGKNIVYLVDNAGQVVTARSATTRQEAMRLAKEEQKLSKTPLTVVDESVTRLGFESRMQGWFDMSDYSRPSRQTGPSKGRQFGEKIDVSPKEFQTMIEQLIRGFKDVERETRGLIFQPQIDFLKYQKGAAGLGNESNTVFDRMVNTIHGTQNLDASTIPGKGLTAFADSYDRLMQNVFDKLSPVMADLPVRKHTAKKEFAQTQKALGDFTPFNDFNDFLAKTADVKLPGELRKHAGALNEITTALTIRIFDVGMGAINMVSLASTLPPVAKMIQPLDEELKGGAVGAAAWRDRIGAWGDVTPGGVPIMNPTKAIISGIHYMFSKEGRALAKKAKEAGFFEQYAAEQVEIFARTGEKFIPGLLRNFTKKTSVITDTTEVWARQISFMTFLDMGKNGMKLSDEAAFTFAHMQANNVIADFRPTNRPVIFQGAAGMPLGLFTTFMWNYLQRMYSIVETKQMGALINQVGLQTMLFGAESVPGVTEFINTFTNNYDGSSNVVDRLNKSMGHAGASAFLNGSISSLLGVSLGPRAAVGVPFSSGLSAQAIPGVRLGMRGIETVWKTIDSVRQEGGIDPSQMATIVAQSGINKGVSNLIEGVQGYALDRNDNIIEQDTRTSIGIWARVAGFKPLLSDELRQENRRNRVTQRKRDNLKERLALQLKAKARAGKLTGKVIDSALQDYIRAGGNSENFRRFFMSQLTKGTTSKLDLDVVKALKQNNDENRVARLLFLSDQ